MFLARRDGHDRNLPGACDTGVRWALIALLALPVACFPAADPASPVFSAEAEDRLTVRLEEIAFQRLAGNRVEFEVRAQQGTFEPIRRVAQLQDVRTFFRDEDRGVIRLKSEAADFDLAKQTFIMTGAVEGTTAAGEHFSTTSARYDRERSKIVVDAPVALQSGRVESQGSGLVFDLASRELTLFDIRGRREAEESR